LSPKPDPFNICACCGSQTFIDTTDMHLDSSHEPANEVMIGRYSLRDSTYQHVINELLEEVIREFSSRFVSDIHNKGDGTTCT
jgi:hypothetical protein